MGGDLEVEPVTVRRVLAAGQPAAAGLVAVVIAAAVWRRSMVDALVLAGFATLVSRRWAFGIALAAFAGFAAVRAGESYAGLAPDRLGPFHGWATVVDDPRPAQTAMRVLLQIEGERFEMWVRGRAGRLRVAEWHGGDVVRVQGNRAALDTARSQRVAWQHVVGAFDYDSLGDRREGRPLAVASNRVREVIARATSSMPDRDAALARGLIIGDDRAQPQDMVERFRRSGLSHLTAVSGQNVAFVLAAAGPLLKRARPMTQLIASLALIGWFVVITRAEPSVLRAGAMASLGAVAYAFGREREPPRLLAVAVTGLLLVDPLLVRSVGFWLSVGATAGVTVIAPLLGRRLRCFGPLAMPLAITLGAQLGVAIPSVLVFGRLSLVGTVANLVAVPIAGFVMLYGLPACLLAGAVPFAGTLIMAPVAVGVRAVDSVAMVAASAEPPAVWSVIGWVAIGIAIVVLVVRGQDGCPVDGEQLRQ